jgi:hypothetical protein
VIAKNSGECFQLAVLRDQAINHCHEACGIQPAAEIDSQRHVASKTEPNRVPEQLDKLLTRLIIRKPQRLV